MGQPHHSRVATGTRAAAHLHAGRYVHAHVSAHNRVRVVHLAVALLAEEGVILWGSAADGGAAVGGGGPPVAVQPQHARTCLQYVAATRSSHASHIGGGASRRRRARKRTTARGRTCSAAGTTKRKRNSPRSRAASSSWVVASKPRFATENPARGTGRRGDGGARDGAPDAAHPHRCRRQPPRGARDSYCTRDPAPHSCQRPPSPGTASQRRRGTAGARTPAFRALPRFHLRQRRAH